MFTEDNFTIRCSNLVNELLFLMSPLLSATEDQLKKTHTAVSLGAVSSYQWEYAVNVNVVSRIQI